MTEQIGEILITIGIECVCYFPEGTIVSRKDLKFYLQEDAKRNGLCSWGGYYLRLLLDYENACAFRYIKCMRKCEYHQNSSNNIST